jgi:hypothetical protein
MNASRAQVAHVIQIAPEHDAVFGGCLMISEAARPWGVQG